MFVLKGFLEWKVHLAHPASLQALPLNTSKQIIQIQHNITGLKTPTGRRQPVGYLQVWPRI